MVSMITAQRAYELYLLGAHPGDANQDWRQAQTEVIREVVLGGEIARNTEPERTAVDP